MVNSERRITLMRAAIDPPGEARADWEIFAAAAPRMGFAGFDVGRRRRGLRRVRGADRGPAVRPVRRLARAARSARARSSGRAARRRTPAPRGSTPTGASTRRPGARSSPRRCPGDPADPPDADHPLVLTTGRIASQWHTMTRTAKSPELVAAEPEPFLELHPDDARRAWVRDGERVRVVSRRGAVKLRVRFDETLRAGTAFAPFHWGALHAPAGAGGVNDLTHRETDPVSRQPGLKATAVRVEPVAARAGASAAERVLDRRRRPRAASPPPRRCSSTATCAITIASAEPGLPYDRVGLTDHLAGHRAATDLPLHNQRWYRERGIALPARSSTRATASRPPSRRRADRLRRARPRDRLAAVHPADRGHRARDRRSARATTCARSAAARTARAARSSSAAACSGWRPRGRSPTAASRSPSSTSPAS